MYSVRRKNCAKSAPPISRPATFEAVRVRRRKILSGRSGACDRDSITKNVTISGGCSPEQSDRLAGCPAVLGRSRHAVDEQHQSAGDRGGAGEVEVTVLELRPALAQEGRGQPDHERSDRDVGEEDPGPAEAARQCAAEEDAGRAAAAGCGAPDPERGVALAALGEGRGQDRQRRRGEQRRAEPLERAERDQRALGPGEPVEERAHGEEREPYDEEAPATEQAVITHCRLSCEK